jgi:hypothetical protein
MQDEWEKFGKGRCEHVSTLLILLGDIFAAARNNKKMEGEVGGDEFVLVLDGIDRQREASQMLLAALARLGEMVGSFSLLNCCWTLLKWTGQLTKVDTFPHGGAHHEHNASSTIPAIRWRRSYQLSTIHAQRSNHHSNSSRPSES